jgi:hypothetical protein
VAVAVLGVPFLNSKQAQLKIKNTTRARQRTAL